MEESKGAKSSKVIEDEENWVYDSSLDHKGNVPLRASTVLAVEDHDKQFTYNRTGGHKPALESFGADQFDDDHREERKQKMSFFNWWSFGLCCGLLLGVTVVVYVQDPAIAKRNQPHASDPAQLYETPKSEKVHGRLLYHTRKLR
ncbi:hypothetical protein DVH24_006155 [Malus domestica]|uniref:Transmembrane protein n=1 Tax=Malus domestica TaxID=3750 RepID=A0A498IDT0_MALDO|nr:hypothetical protein DVH24_006155 [Malus domestica]